MSRRPVCWAEVKGTLSCLEGVAYECADPLSGTVRPLDCNERMDVAVSCLASTPDPTLPDFFGSDNEACNGGATDDGCEAICNDAGVFCELADNSTGNASGERFDCICTAGPRQGRRFEARSCDQSALDSALSLYCR